MKLDLFKWEKPAWIASALLVLISIIAMGISWVQFQAPFKPGLDFVGGTRLQLQLECASNDNCPATIDVAKVQDILNGVGLGNSSVQVIEDYTLSIRQQTLDVEQREAVQKALNEGIGKFDPETIQIDTVGPTVGKALFRSGVLALVISLLGIIVYLTIRFQLDYAVFAIVALLYDALITMGAFAIFGLLGGVEVDSLFLVALLTIIGFSVNDTVVIYDRVRETLERHPDWDINHVVDDAVNQTLTRSINTSLTTSLPLVAIFLFGGDSLKFFALALIIGFASGVYSSIFMATTLWAWWRKRRSPRSPKGEVVAEV
ncbi:protein translocase subunit SecF [Synechocystis sp. PCC 7339]|uniref:protein translocase subunit SecF n=1 Tax=unclassified Synechocystis TaxID=2640012 RepID=UPI001BAE969E|nr:MULTISPECIES: protein translocase subunit SecF [unclassified Synechocystis]QUS60562.1 protein translocase subunit SecF [Synechocystis sp. PCC 7338]UAJ71993.1 protein translocase subunit SecF [Synechocystis sp. PCC 7339]